MASFCVLLLSFFFIVLSLFSIGNVQASRKLPAQLSPSHLRSCSHNLQPLSSLYDPQQIHVTHIHVVLHVSAIKK
ncbi:hypothetical protein GLYMA_15G057350v4 [Glycine max]|nr:hypothetical protein GLYMA_15G057350v4 [Glycine max]KAH1145750.1 hypothetical protein GYH30_041457 [Glycine max]